MREMFKKITGALGALSLDACSPDAENMPKAPEPIVAAADEKHANFDPSKVASEYISPSGECVFVSLSAEEAAAGEALRAEKDAAIDAMQKQKDDDIAALYARKDEILKELASRRETLGETQYYLQSSDADSEFFAKREKVEVDLYNATMKKIDEYDATPLRIKVRDSVLAEGEKDDCDIKARLNEKGRSAFSELAKKQQKERESFTEGSHKTWAKMTEKLDGEWAALETKNNIEWRKAVTQDQKTAEIERDEQARAEFYDKKRKVEDEYYNKDSEAKTEFLAHQEQERIELLRHPEFLK